MARKTKVLSRAERIAVRVNTQMREEVVTLASDPRYVVHRIPTGNLTIDRLLGGGFARGRHHELYGDWSANKSRIVYTTLALAQQRGEVCALIDTEHIFDASWFKRCGGDPRSLLMGHAPANDDPLTADKIGKTLQLMVRDFEDQGVVDVIAVDSVASLLPKEELEKDMEEGDDRVASLARLMSRVMRRVTTQNDDTTIIWVNQWRDKIGRIPGLNSTPGGRAMGFYASTRVELTRAEKETEDREVIRKGQKVKRKQPIGQWVNCRSTKNKTNAPERQASFMYSFELQDIDVAREVVDLGMTDGVISRTGDYYSYTSFDGTEHRSHGIKRFTKMLYENEDVMSELVSLIEEKSIAIGMGEDD